MDQNAPPSPTEEVLTPRAVGRWLAEYTRLSGLALPPTGASEARFKLRTSTYRYCVEVQATESDYRLRCFVLFEGNGATCLNDGPSTERTLRAIMATILRNELVDAPAPVALGAAPPDRPRGPRKGAMINNPTVIALAFQHGPIREVGYNGCQIEDVIDVLVNRLEEFQAGLFPCPENDSAIRRLLMAKASLGMRTLNRQEQGVEGTSAPHESP